MQAETIDKIRLAIERISSSDYGICESCQEQIPVKRLRAVPFTTRCRNCQETTESVERRARVSGPAYSVWLSEKEECAGGTSTGTSTARDRYASGCDRGRHYCANSLIRATRV